MRLLNYINKSHFAKALIFQGARLLFGLGTTLVIGRTLSPSEIASWFLMVNLFGMMQIYEYGFSQVMQRYLSSRGAATSQVEGVNVYSVLAVVITFSILPVIGVLIFVFLYNGKSDLTACVPAALSLGLASLSTNVALIALSIHLVRFSQWLLLVQSAAIFLATILITVISRSVVSLFWFQGIASLLVLCIGLKVLGGKVVLRKLKLAQLFENAFNIIVCEKLSIARLAFVMVSFQVMTRLLHASISRVLSPPDFAAYGLSVQMIGVAVALSSSLFSIALPSVTSAYSGGGITWKKIFFRAEVAAIVALIALLSFVLLFVLTGISHLVWPGIKFDNVMLLLMALYVAIELVIGHLSQLLVAIRIELHLYANLIAAIFIATLFIYFAKYLSGVEILTYRFMIYFVICGAPILFLFFKTIIPVENQK